MNDLGIIECVKLGRMVTIKPESWPCKGKFTGLRVSVFGPAWNGMLTLNKSISSAELEAEPEPEKLIEHTIREMLDNINW